MKIINIADFYSFEKLYKQYTRQIKETLSNESSSETGSTLSSSTTGSSTTGSQLSPADLQKSLLLLFVGDQDLQTKESWCFHCRMCKPIVDKVINDFQFNDQLILAMVNVGQREEWKTDDNPFRRHPLHITAVPTLLSIKREQRLVEAECADQLKVYHLFSNSM